MKVWRLSKAIYAESSFSGEDARLFGGRWNPAGVRMVYTSASLALASVELFLHLDPSLLPTDMVSVSTMIPDAISIERIALAELPVDWRRLDHPTLRKLGADWIASKSSAAMQVPSAAVAGDWNMLLNPAHADFSRILRHGPAPWSFDKRMFR